MERRGFTRRPEPEAAPLHAANRVSTSLLFILISGFVIVLSSPQARGQALDTPATNSANVQSTTVPIEAPTPPAITNGLPAPTNPPPIKAGSLFRPSSSDVISAFSGNMGGKFTLSGRTLKLPSPEAAPRPADAWQRILDFGMNMTRGDSETLRYELGVDASKTLDDDFFRMRARGAYGESSQIKDTENANAGFRYEHMLTKNVYGLGNLFWMNDTIAGLRYRTTGIVSPGFRLVRTDTTLLNLEDGAGYISEKKTGVGGQNYAAGRAAITAEHILNAHVLTWVTTEYFPKLSDTSMFFMDTEAGISVVLTRDLSLNVFYQVRYDSEPVEGKKATNSTMTTALSLNF